MTIAPSGQQFGIADGGHRATVVEVGGGIREYVHDGRPVLDGYGPDEMCSGARGAPLMPWPNRLEDGQYTFAGRTYQLPLSEPKTHNAIHGLLRWRNYSERERDAARVVVGTVLHPHSGYPFVLDVAIEYAVSDGTTPGRRPGLTVTTTATNLGATALPFASGQHPYLAAGAPLIDEAILRLDAEQWIPTDERGLPAGVEPVAGSPLDFRAPRQVGDTLIDHAFTGLARDADGLAWLELTAPDGRTTRLWADHSYSYLQLYTGDTQAPSRRRRSVAVEPMTGPPNALRSGEGLIVIEPGSAVTMSWGIEPG